MEGGAVVRVGRGLYEVVERRANRAHGHRDPKPRKSRLEAERLAAQDVHRAAHKTADDAMSVTAHRETS
jgi:hypothetical protein